MKTILFPLIIALALAGCAATPPATTTTTTNAPAGPVGDMSNPEAENPPFIGMTRAQALARYGHPKKQTTTDEGENWVYVLNLGAVIGKAMIPFNFKPTLVRTGVLIFGPNGRVKKFNWDTPPADE
jgi:hypothetical protein